MSKRSYTQMRSHQKGVAAIMFILMLPALLGMMVFGIDGAHFLRAKADVGDAMELASLALSAKGSQDLDENRLLAKNYIKAQFFGTSGSPSIYEDGETDNHDRDISVDVEKHTCVDSNSGCIGKGDDENKDGKFDRSFLEYSVRGTVTVPSLFPLVGKNRIGFEKEYDMAASSMARKYQNPSVDIYLVADFSGSMVSNNEGSITRFARLKEIVKTIEDVVKTASASQGVNNTISLVPFDVVTQDDYTGCAITQLVLKQPIPVAQENIFDWQIDPIDFDETLNQLFQKKQCVSETIEDENYKEGYPEFWKRNKHKVVKHDDAAEHISNEMENMDVSDTAAPTSSYEGIVRAAQLALTGKNARRLIIVLSDGEDSPKNDSIVLNLIVNEPVGWDENDNLILKPAVRDYPLYISPKDIHKKLIEMEWPENLKKELGFGNAKRGYCKAIEKKFSNLPRVNVNGSSLPVELQMSFIGFGYAGAPKNVNIEKCVGAENVFYASNMDEVEDKVLALLGDEVGSIYTEYELDKDEKK